MSAASPKARISRTRAALGIAIAGLLAVFSGGLLLITAGTAGSTPVSADPSVGYTEWVNQGDPVLTHENVPPGATTDTERWMPVGEPTQHVTTVGVPEGPYVATGEVITTEDELTPPPAAGDLCRWAPVGAVDDDSEDVAAVRAIEAQHYSWKGGNLPVSTPPTVVPPHAHWAKNATQEPHDSKGDPATWVNDSLHYTNASQQGAAWFYWQPYVPGKDKVEGKDFQWAKECKTTAVAEVSHLDYVWQKQVRTEVAPPVVTPPVVTPPVVTLPEVAPEDVPPRCPVQLPWPGAEEPTKGPQATEQAAPEVLGEQASAPAEQASAPAEQVEVPTVVDAGYAGQPSGDGWATALLVGGLLLLASATAVTAACRT